MAGQKGRSGRPRRYLTEKEAKDAIKASKLASYHRSKERQPEASSSITNATGDEQETHDLELPAEVRMPQLFTACVTNLQTFQAAISPNSSTLRRSSRQASQSSAPANCVLVAPCGASSARQELPDIAALSLSESSVSNLVSEGGRDPSRDTTPHYSRAVTPPPSCYEASDSESALSGGEEDSEMVFECSDDDEELGANTDDELGANTTDQNDGYARAAARLLDACSERCQCSESNPTGDSAYSLAEMTRYWQDLLPEGLKNYPLDNPEVGAREKDCQRIPWRPLMAGGDGGPPGLSFAKSELPSTADVEVKRRWDIDSFLAGPTTLAVHRGGFKLSYQPPYLRRITQNQRVRIGGHQVHKLKQLRLGEGVAAGGYGIECHVVFPHMEVKVPGETHLSYRRQAVWFDRIVIPALKHACPPDVLHHHPCSFRDACFKAKARTEHHISSTAAPMDIRYAIPTRYLDAFWTEVKQLSHSHAGDPRIPIDAFRDPTLVLSGHGLKLWTKEDTLGAARDEFLRHLDDCFAFTPDTLPDTECWVDLGVEDTPASNGPGITLLRKQHCLDGWAMKFISPDHEAHLTTVERHRWMTTRDSGDIVVELKASNGLRANGGMAYNKAYSVNKEVFATPFKGCAPFQNPQFEALGYSQELIERHHKASGRTRSGTPSKAKRQGLLNAYRQTKRRVWSALTDSMDRSYGVRQEYRISMALLRRLPETVEQMTDGHRPYWVLPTRDVNGFIAAELNRWLLCLEALIGETAVGVEQSMQLVNGTMVSVLVRVLHMHIGCDPPSHQPIWRGEWRSRARQRRRGLNLQASVEEHGLAWFPAEHAHWNIVPTFTARALETLSIPKNGFQKTFGARGDVYERLSQEDRMYQLFREQLRASPANGAKLGGQLAVQRYVKDILMLLAERGIAEHKSNPTARFAAYKAKAGLTEEEAAGLDGLSLALVRKLTIDGEPRIATPHAGNGEGTGHFWGAKVGGLFWWSDDDEDSRARKTRWDGAGFRVFTQRLHSIVVEEAGAAAGKKFIGLVYLSAFNHLWAIPQYSTATLSVLYQASKNHSRATQARVRGLSTLERTNWLVPQMAFEYCDYLEIVEDHAAGQEWPRWMSREETRARLIEGLAVEKLFVHSRQDRVALIPEDPRWFGLTPRLELAASFSRIVQGDA